MNVCAIVSLIYKNSGYEAHIKDHENTCKITLDCDVTEKEMFSKIIDRYNATGFKLCVFHNKSVSVIDGYHSLREPTDERLRYISRMSAQAHHSTEHLSISSNRMKYMITNIDMPIKYEDEMCLVVCKLKNDLTILERKFEDFRDMVMYHPLFGTIPKELKKDFEDKTLSQKTVIKRSAN